MTLVRCSALVALMMVGLPQPAPAAELTRRQALAEHGNSRELKQAKASCLLLLRASSHAGIGPAIDGHQIGDR